MSLLQTQIPTSGNNVSYDAPSQGIYTITKPVKLGVYTSVISISSSTVNVGNNPVVIPITVQVADRQCFYLLWMPLLLK